eukprot:12409499-Heterocapsa_arctica.AAC.1
MDAIHGKGAWAPIPAFCITQGDGKRRRIDNGKRGGHNEATIYSERLHLCSAFQPGLHARLILDAASEAGADLGTEGITLESGGEDLPSAFRSI